MFKVGTTEGICRIGTEEVKKMMLGGNMVWEACKNPYPRGIPLTAVNSFVTGGSAMETIDEEGQRLFIGDMTTAIIRVFDISDPGSISEVDTINVPGILFRDIYFRNNTLYFADGTENIYSLNVDAADGNYKQYTSVSFAGHVVKIFELVAYGDYLYGFDAYLNNTYVIEMGADYTNTTKIGLYTDGTKMGKCFASHLVQDHYILTCNYETDMIYVMDVITPTSPSIIYEHSLASGTQQGAYYDSVNEHFYYNDVTLGAIIILDVLDMSNIVEYSRLTDSRVQGRYFSVFNNILYTASYATDSITSVDISDPANMKILDSITSTDLNNVHSTTYYKGYLYSSSYSSDKLVVTKAGEVVCKYENSMDMGYAETFKIIEGELFAGGRNYQGVLGFGDEVSLPYMKSTGIHGCKQISVRNTSALLLKIDGSVWSCGSGSNGQTGLGHANAVSTFTDTGHTAVAIYAGFRASYIVKADNTLWATGVAAANAQASDTTVFTQTSITLAEGDSVHVGLSDTIVQRANNDLYGTGLNYSGELGLGHTNDIYDFTALSITGAVAACPQHAFFIRKTDDTLYSAGYNSSGTLGLGHFTDPISTFTDTGHTYGVGTTDVADLQWGDVHVIMLLNDGSILTAGEGSYGRLGMATDTDLSVFTDTGFKGSAIYAQLGSSFYVSEDGSSMHGSGYAYLYAHCNDSPDNNFSFSSDVTSSIMNKFEIGYSHHVSPASSTVSLDYDVTSNVGDFIIQFYSDDLDVPYTTNSTPDIGVTQLFRDTAFDQTSTAGIHYGVATTTTTTMNITYLDTSYAAGTFVTAVFNKVTEITSYANSATDTYVSPTVSVIPGDICVVALFGQDSLELFKPPAGFTLIDSLSRSDGSGISEMCVAYKHITEVDASYTPGSFSGNAVGNVMRITTLVLA